MPRERTAPSLVSVDFPPTPCTMEQVTTILSWGWVVSSLSLPCPGMRAGHQFPALQSLQDKLSLPQQYESALCFPSLGSAQHSQELSLYTSPTPQLGGNVLVWVIHFPPEGVNGGGEAELSPTPPQGGRWLSVLYFCGEALAGLSGKMNTHNQQAFLLHLYREMPTKKIIK